MRALGMVLLAAAAWGQQPQFVNSRVSHQTFAGNLDRFVTGQPGPLWIGYSVRRFASEHNGCCASDRRPCRLDGNNDAARDAAAVTGAVRLEGATWLSVLYRVENGAIGRVRAYSGECVIDAGELPVVWLEAVGSRESLAELSSLVQGGKERDGALAAIAQHEDGEAERVLERFAAAPEEEHLREKALFWLGAQRGHAGYLAVRKAATTDPSAWVREKAVFPLSISPDPEAITALLQVAKSDAEPRVRRQAIFWLGQKAGRKQMEAIRGAIDNDPDTEVKKKAVFAVQNLPNGEGVPALLDVARNHRNPEVRKQAIFWLGQSRDPRALEFFESVLLQ